MLVAVAGRLAGADGTADVIARLGGDEFLVLFDGDDAERDAVSYAERALHALRAPIVAGEGEVFLTASIGVACTSVRVSEATPLLSNADAATYQAKKRGGGTVEVFGEIMRMRVLDRMHTEHSLHRALERRELAALLPARGGDPRGPGRRGRGAVALGASRTGAGGPQPVHPRGRGERPDHPHRRLGLQ